MNNELTLLIQKLEEGINNLKERTDFRTLRHQDQVWLIDSLIEKVKKTGDKDAREHLRRIRLETSPALEGEDFSNSTIWNANISVQGSMTTLDYLFQELNEYPQNE